VKGSTHCRCEAIYLLTIPSHASTRTCHHHTEGTKCASDVDGRRWLRHCAHAPVLQGWGRVMRDVRCRDVRTHASDCWHTVVNLVSLVRSERRARELMQKAVYVSCNCVCWQGARRYYSCHNRPSVNRGPCHRILHSGQFCKKGIHFKRQ
jgi:hypothetical protein